MITPHGWGHWARGDPYKAILCQLPPVPVSPVCTWEGLHDFLCSLLLASQGDLRQPYTSVSTVPIPSPGQEARS